MGNLITMVVATRNRGKTAEIRGLLKGFNVIIKNLDDFGPIPEVEEDGDTFDDNAYKKASFAARVLGLPALADDSGLLVQALDGAPGVHSARYAGKDASDEEKCLKLLQAMKGKTDRKAAFEFSRVIEHRFWGYNRLDLLPVFMGECQFIGAGNTCFAFGNLLAENL